MELAIMKFVMILFSW